MLGHLFLLSQSTTAGVSVALAIPAAGFSIRRCTQETKQNRPKTKAG